MKCSHTFDRLKQSEPEKNVESVHSSSEYRRFNGKAPLGWLTPSGLHAPPAAIRRLLVFAILHPAEDGDFSVGTTPNTSRTASPPLLRRGESGPKCGEQRETRFLHRGVGDQLRSGVGSGLRPETADRNQSLVLQGYGSQDVGQGEDDVIVGYGQQFGRTFRQPVLQVLQRQWDPSFSEHSYGFRPGRSAHQAVAQAQKNIAEGYSWVVDFDLENFSIESITTN